MQTTGKKVITRVLGLTYAPCTPTRMTIRSSQSKKQSVPYYIINYKLHYTNFLSRFHKTIRIHQLVPYSGAASFLRFQFRPVS